MESPPPNVSVVSREKEKAEGQREKEGREYDDATTTTVLKAAAFQPPDVEVEDTRVVNGDREDEGGGMGSTASHDNYTGDDSGSGGGGGDDEAEADEAAAAAALRHDIYARLPPTVAAGAMEADRHVTLGSAHFLQGNFDLALGCFARALELRRHALGRAHALTAATESDCG